MFGESDEIQKGIQTRESDLVQEKKRRWIKWIKKKDGNTEKAGAEKRK